VALGARYLADKSALARFKVPLVGERLRPLLEEGLVASCAIVDLEVLFSSKSMTDYDQILLERRSIHDVPITSEVWELVFTLQRELASRGQHRLPIPDIIISAAAKSAGLIVLHFDSDFERICSVGGADQEWVVSPGSI
jgi:predicted nucleic acid-binding protein